MMIVRTEVHENNDMFSNVMHIVSIDMYGFTGVVVSAIYLILLLKINATFYNLHIQSSIFTPAMIENVLSNPAICKYIQINVDIA